MRCYVEQMSKIQAQKTLQLMEAFWLGSPTNSDEEHNNKTRKINELFQTIDPGYGKQDRKMEWTAQAMEIMALGIDVEVIEGVIVKDAN